MYQEQQISEGYKQTSIGIIPEDWEEMELGKIGKFFKGKGVPKDKIVKEGFKCLTYGDLYTKYDILIKDVKSHITQETAEISQQIEFGDICIAGSGETIEDIGKCATFVADEIGYAGGDIIVFRSDNNAVTLSYIINSDTAKRQKYKFGQGHSVVHIYSSQLEKLKIPLPPLPEQQKIAEILSAWDKAIELCQKTIEELKQRNKGLAQQLLSGKTRVKGFEDTVWRFTKIGDILVESNLPSVNQSHPDKRITVKLNLKGIEKREFRGTEVEGATYFYTRKAGQFIYGKQNLHKGAFGIIPIELNNYDSSSDIPAFDFKEKFNSKFILYFFSRKSFYERLENYSTGTGSKRIQPKELFKIEIKIPNIEEQEKIAEILDTAAFELKHYEEKLQNLKLQKKGLMQQLLTGKVRTV